MAAQHSSPDSSTLVIELHRLLRRSSLFLRCNQMVVDCMALHAGSQAAKDGRRRSHQSPHQFACSCRRLPLLAFPQQDQAMPSLLLSLSIYLIVHLVVLQFPRPDDVCPQSVDSILGFAGVANPVGPRAYSDIQASSAGFALFFPSSCVTFPVFILLVVLLRT